MAKDKPPKKPARCMIDVGKEGHAIARRLAKAGRRTLKATVLEALAAEERRQAAERKAFKEWWEVVP